MTNLAEQVQRTADWLAGQRAFIDILHVDVFDPDALAGALENLPARLSGVATIALDHPRVRAAIDELAARGVAGGDPGVGRAELAPHALCRHRQSGRRPHRGDADGPLPARDARERSASSRVRWSLRDHAERQFGFHQILSSEYPDLARAAGARRPRRQRAHPGADGRACSRAIPISSASTASAPATGASPPRWRTRAAPATSSGSPMN